MQYILEGSEVPILFGIDDGENDAFPNSTEALQAELFPEVLGDGLWRVPKSTTAPSAQHQMSVTGERCCMEH